MNTLYHLYSRGERTLFRDKADYICFCNKFGMLSHKFRIQPIALSVMSTHFHAIAEPMDFTELSTFFTTLKRAYMVYYSARYLPGKPIQMHISSKEIAGIEMTRNELLYVAKNPVHHYVTSIPLVYPFSSISYTFSDMLVPYTITETYKETLRPIYSLPAIRKKKIAARIDVPDNWMVDHEGMISFSSYINMQRARAFWNNNVKSFMFDMNKNQTDAAGAVIQEDIQDLRTNGISDTKVCKIIDEYAKDTGHSSFFQLEKVHIDHLVKTLTRFGASPEQIKRCL